MTACLIGFLVYGLIHVNAECVNETLPTFTPVGCSWNEVISESGCLSHEIACNETSTIDKRCLLSPSKGTCLSLHTTYYYDVRTGQCVPLVYGRCNGNDNNFATSALCEDVCIKGLPRAMDPSKRSAVNATDLKCGKNEEVMPCGNCDDICGQPATICPAVCRTPACGCIEGFLKNKQGSCVSRSECEQQQPQFDQPVVDDKCGTNETLKTCGSCDSSCVNPLTACDMVCRSPECGCRDGFVRDARHRCILIADCPVKGNKTRELVCKGENEIVHSCGACDAKCNEPPPTCSLACDEPECGCANGYLRDHNRVCVLPQSCAPDNACANVVCPSKHTCVNGTCVDSVASTNCPVVNVALASEGCTYEEEVNEAGCSVPKLMCKDLKCKENEEVKICGACDPTCEKPICSSSLLCKQPECGCIDGFVRNRSGECINATMCVHGAIIDHRAPGLQKVSRPKCGLNEELKACGSACAPTCTVPEPVCESHCINDVCQCKKGYVAYTNGSCIALADCPEFRKSKTECGPQETFTNCGSACEPTCEKPEPTVCTLQCVVDVCQCVKGYVRNTNGRCVRTEECKAPAAVIEANQVCGLNEHFTACGTECEPTCSEPFPAFCTDHCVVDVCQCAPGFVRDTNNKCVRFTECQEVDDSSCGRFEKFQSCGTACEPTCDNPNPKDCTQQCILDVCQCRVGYVRNDKGKCIKKSHCPKKDAPKEERICGTHEKFQTCGSACEPTCENTNPAFCTDQCIVDVCQCEAGFLQCSRILADMDGDLKTPTEQPVETPTLANGSVPLLKIEEEETNDEKVMANGGQNTNETSSEQKDNDADDNESYTPSMDERNDELPELYDNFHSSFTLNEMNGDAQVDCINDHLPVPPDGGYGWVIVFAAFVANFFVDGVANSFGAFIKSYEQEFQASTAVTSLIGSLLIGVYLLIGPVAGGLVNNFGARPVVIVGSLLTAAAFFLAVYATNIFVFMFLYGVIGGIGFGFVYLPAIVVVGYYFESKRALATGLAVAGSGFGTFVMPIVCTICINNFGWKNTLWILAGLILLCALCGLLYRPLTFPEIDLEEQRREEMEPLKSILNKLHQYDEEEANGRPLSQISLEDGPMKPPTSLAVTRTNSVSTNAEKDDLHHGMDSVTYARLRSALSECENEESPATPVRPGPPLSPINENKVISKSRAGSTYNHGDRHIYPQRDRKLTLTSMASAMTSNQDLKMSRHNLSSQLSRISARSYAQSLSRLSQNPQSLKAGDSMLSVALSGVDPKEFMRPLNRRDIFYQGSIRNLKEFEEEGSNFRNYRESQISIPAAVVAQSMSQLPHGGDGTDFGSRMSRITGGLIAEDLEEADFCDDSNCKCIPFVIRNAFTEMIDLQLLREPIMLLLTISNILGMLGFYVPFMFVMSMAQEKHVEAEKAALLLSIIGITNTFGRVIFGWVADRGWMSALAITNISLLSCGVLTCICPFLPGFAGYCIYAVLFGFIIAAYICLTSIVLSDLLGLERLTNSFGLLVVGRGIASLLGTPIAGIVYDITMSYDASFVFAGILIILSGLVSCAIPFIHRHQRNQMKNEGGEDNADGQSGKLSVLTERSEENLTEYQRTIQSLRQQHQLLQEYEEERKRQMQQDRVSNVNEEDESSAHPDLQTPEASPMHPPTAPLISNPAN